jgi:hypothetical protein
VHLDKAFGFVGAGTVDEGEKDRDRQGDGELGRPSWWLPGTVAFCIGYLQLAVQCIPPLQAVAGVLNIIMTEHYGVHISAAYRFGTVRKSFLIFVRGTSQQCRGGNIWRVHVVKLTCLLSLQLACAISSE